MKITRITHIHALILFLSLLFCLGCRKVHIPLNTSLQEAKPVFHMFNGRLGMSNNSAIVAYDGNLLICGNEGNKLLVLKITKKGDLIWKKTLNPGRGSVASGITESKDHDIFICGRTDINYDNYKADIMLVKVSGAGDSLWTKTYGGTENDTGYNIITSSDGHLMLAAKTESFGSHQEGDIYLLKINTEGQEIWTKRYEDEGMELPYHLMQTREGGYLITGTNQDYQSNPLTDLYVFKVGPDGTYLWKNSVYGHIWGYSTVELANGDLLTCARRQLFTSSFFLHKTNSTGDIFWQIEQPIRNNEFTGPCSIIENPDHTYTMTGYFKPSVNAKKSVLFMKLDSQANELGIKKFGEAVNNCEGLNLIRDTNGDNLIIGQTDTQIFLTRLDADGNFK